MAWGLTQSGFSRSLAEAMAALPGGAPALPETSGSAEEAARLNALVGVRVLMDEMRREAAKRL